MISYGQNKIVSTERMTSEILPIRDVWQLVFSCWLLSFLIGLFDQLKILIVFLAFKLDEKASCLEKNIW